MSGGVPATSQGGLPAAIDQFRLPTLVAAAGERAGVRFLEFFASTIRNPDTRRAYARAVEDFLAWCEEHAVPSLPRCSRCMWRLGSRADRPELTKRPFCTHKRTKLEHGWRKSKRTGCFGRLGGLVLCWTDDVKQVISVTGVTRSKSGHLMVKSARQTLLEWASVREPDSRSFPSCWWATCASQRDGDRQVLDVQRDAFIAAVSMNVQEAKTRDRLGPPHQG